MIDKYIDASSSLDVQY